MLGTASASGGDQIANKLDSAIEPVASFLEKIIFFSFSVAGQSLPVVLVVLGGTAIFLTIYFKFLNVRALGLAFRTVKGKYTDKDAPGQITHFQALTAAYISAIYPDRDRIDGITVLMDLPENVIPYSYVALGYPAKVPGAREAFSNERVHYNSWVRKKSTF